MNAKPQLSILYEDEHLLAVDKPAGICVIPGRGDDGVEPLVKTVMWHIGRKAFVVHRIDKDTSGVVLFAKDAETHRALSMAFERREVKKTYLALVEGEVPEGGVIRSPLKDRGSGRVSVHPQGKAAETGYAPLKRVDGKTLLEVSPLTGRRHQIRVHLYSIGHRIAGDPLYGKPKGDEGRMMLHAWKLALPQDGTGQLEIESPMPADFRTMLETLR